MRIILIFWIFWAQMEPLQDLAAHLVCALMNKDTPPVIMTHRCPHQHTFRTETLQMDLKEVLSSPT